MKKRLLSMLLLVAMIATALPLGVLSLVSFAAEAKEMTEEDYDALYVTDDLLYSIDFFKLNEYWSPEGHDYEINVGPSDDKAFYDATTGKTFDFTVKNNRYSYTVTKTAADGTVTTLDTTYLGEAEANAAVAELTAAETEGASYAAVMGTAMNAAWTRAVEKWISLDNDLFKSFRTHVTVVDGKTPYLSSANSSFGTMTDGRQEYARSAIASFGDGYISLLPSGKTYAGGGGVQLLGAPAGLGTLQTVTVLEGALNGAGGYVLFNNAGLIPTRDATTATYTMKGMEEGRSVKIGEATETAAIPYQKVTSLTYTMADGEFRMYNGTETALAAPYTGTPSATYYFGWAARSLSTKLYAIRYYLDVLTAEERAQNHFADIAKFFRLDVSGFASKNAVGIFAAEDVKTYYNAFSAVDFNSTKSEVEAVASAAYSILMSTVSYPELTLSDYNELYVKDDRLFQIDFFPLNPYWDMADQYTTLAASDTAAATKSGVLAWMNQFTVYSTSSVYLRLEGSTKHDAYAVTYDHYIPFFVEDGYIRIKNMDEYTNFDGYMMRDNNPYLQFGSPNPDLYNVGGFTWEMQMSLDEFTKTGSFSLPALSDIRPSASISTTKKSITVSSASGFTAENLGTLTHSGRPFDLTYRMEVTEGSYDVSLTASGQKLGDFTRTTAFKGSVSDFGWNFNESGAKLYASRLYDRSLTDEELAQNHFADIVKYFRIDVSEFAAKFKMGVYSNSALRTYYSAFAGLDFHSMKSEVEAVADAAFAVLTSTLSYPELELEDYNTLYVTDDILLQADFFALNGFWERSADYGTIEVANSGSTTAGNVTYWLRKFVVQGGTSPYFVIAYKSVLDAAGTYSPQIPFLIKDGYVQFKSPESIYTDASLTTKASEPPYLQLYFPNGYTVGDEGHSMETVVSYGDVTPNLQAYNWLPATLNLYPRVSLTADSFKITSSGTWSSTYTLDSQPTFVHGDKPFTLTYNLETDGSTTSAEILANGDSLTTATRASVDGGQTANFGYFYGSHQMRLYAIRLYDRSLSAEEVAQNHFADIAKFFRLDVAEFMEYAPLFDDADRNAYYAAFADLGFDSSREEAQAVADAAYAILAAGLDIETHDADYYNALYVKRDLLFQLDFFALNDRWGMAEDFGTITAAASSGATKSAVVSWLRQFVVANPGNVGINVNGTTGDAGATDYNHQIPFFIKDGYIQYKDFADGYAVNNNNPYLQFQPTDISVYNNGGFTWEMQVSFDEFSKTSFNLPALSDIRPAASANATSFTVTGASGFEATNLSTLTHNDRAFDLTYRLDAAENNYVTRLTSGNKTLGVFTREAAFSGKVCDYGWNFNEAKTKIYAVRLYDRSLTDTELLQNHFADLAKCYRLDLGEFSSLSSSDKQAVYEAFAAYDLRTSSFATLQVAYNELIAELTVKKYEAHYLEGEAYAAHNAFIDACIAKFRADGTLLAIDAIYAIPLAERSAIYALSGATLTQKAIDDAVADYWSFDEEEYHSYDKLYYDEGNLVVAYDFFALNSYWNADRVMGYLPTSASLASWESRAADGHRYIDRFAVKGLLSLLSGSTEVPFVIPAGDARGLGGFVLLGGSGDPADGLGFSGLNSSAVTAEAVLLVDGATKNLFTVSGLSLGIENGAYTAPEGIFGAAVASTGTPTLGNIDTYSLVAKNAGLGAAASLALSVNGAEALRAVGTAMADPTGSATLGQGQSFVGAVYAIRYYRTELTAAQMAQNHFADIAKFYRLNLADIDAILAHGESAAALYAAFADFGFAASRETVQAVYDDFRLAFLAAHSDLEDLRAEAEELVTLEGYQVRVSGTEGTETDAVAGMRGIFTVDPALIAALESRGYTVLVDVRTRNAEKGNTFFGRIATVPLYNGNAFVAKQQTIDEIGECYVITVIYGTTHEDGSVTPLTDERVRELMLFDVAYDCTVTLTKDGVSYRFVFDMPSEKFGESIHAGELYHYVGTDGEGDMRGEHKNDALVRKMLSLMPAEQSAIEAPTVGKLTLAADAEAQYAVTLPETATEADIAAVDSFLAKLSALTGATFVARSETGLYLDREIVIANGSERADAAEFAADAASRGLRYAVGVSGERILVYAENDVALSEALAALLGSVTDNKTDDSLGDNRNKFYLPAALSIERSARRAADVSDFTVVLPANMANDRRTKVEEYLTALAARTGITLTVATDTAAVSGRRILIATAADNQAAAALLAGSSYTGYTVTPVGDDILVTAYFDVALRVALSTLFATVSDEGLLPTDVTVACDFGYGEGIPHLATEGALVNGAIYNAGSNTYTVVYKGVTEAEYSAYLALLAERGFERVAENAIADCLFATYRAFGRAVVLAYYPSTAEVKISLESADDLFTGETAYTVNPSVTPSLTLMDHELASYVMQLEDGSFLIVDGGDLVRKGALDKMWAHISSLTPAGQKPVISMWMITHGHSDHVNLAAAFLEKYHNDIVLKAVAFNHPDYESVDMKSEYDAYKDGITVDAANFVAVLDRYYPDVERWIPRTGEKHTVGGAEIEILFSHEDYYPSKIHWGNDTSSAWRITLGGTSTVFLGDMTDSLCKKLAATYGEELEADILQVSHHGVGGGDLGLYQLIDPKICLFGTSIGEFTGDRCNGTGNYTSYNYNTWIRTTDWTRVVDGVEVTGERTHYHGSIRTTILLPIDE